MKTKQPLKQLVAITRSLWEQAETDPNVRENLDKIMKCRTRALGAEVYASDYEVEGILPYLQIEILPELWPSSDASLATRAVVCLA